MRWPFFKHTHLGISLGLIKGDWNFVQVTFCSHLVLTAASFHRNMGYYVPCCPGKIALIRKRLHENQMMVNGQVSSAFAVDVWCTDLCPEEILRTICELHVQQLSVAVHFKDHSHVCHLYSMLSLHCDQRPGSCYDIMVSLFWSF